MIFFYFLILNLILFFLFLIIQHSFEAYRWGAYIQTHDQLRRSNLFGYNFEKVNEQNICDLRKISYERYYVEDWYHPVIPDEDYLAENFFNFKHKSIFDSSTLEIDLKFKGSIKFYNFFYKENTSKLILSTRDHFLINKNIDEKIFFKEFNHEPIPFFLMACDPLTSDQLWYEVVDNFLPEWKELSPRNKSVVFFKQ
jgi:hypothetical protein